MTPRFLKQLLYYSLLLTIFAFTTEVAIGQFARAIESGRQNQDGAITDQAVLEAFDDALAFVQEADSYDELLDLPGAVRHLEGPILEAVFEQLPWYLKTYLLAEQFVVDQCSSDESNGQICLSRRARALKSVLEDLAPFHGYQLVRTEDGFAMQGDHNVHIDLSNAADGRPRLAIAGQSIVELSQQNQATLLQTTHDGKATEKAETLIDETLDNLGMAIDKLAHNTSYSGFVNEAHAAGLSLAGIIVISIIIAVAFAVMIFFLQHHQNERAAKLKLARLEALSTLIEKFTALNLENEITLLTNAKQHIDSSEQLDGISADKDLAEKIGPLITWLREQEDFAQLDTEITFLESINTDLAYNSEGVGMPIR